MERQEARRGQERPTAAAAAPQLVPVHGASVWLLSEPPATDDHDYKKFNRTFTSHDAKESQLLHLSNSIPFRKFTCVVLLCLLNTNNTNDNSRPTHTISEHCQFSSQCQGSVGNTFKRNKNRASIGLRTLLPNTYYYQSTILPKSHYYLNHITITTTSVYRNAKGTLQPEVH